MPEGLYSTNAILKILLRDIITLILIAFFGKIKGVKILFIKIYLQKQLAGEIKMTLLSL